MKEVAITRLADRFLNARWLPVVFWLLTALLLLGANLPWHLDNYDQAKQAYVSYEIVETGEWFFQHTPQQKSATKPPLVGWISVVLYHLSGSWDLAWRLPGLVAAVGLLVLIYREGRNLLPVAGGLLAVGAVFFNFLTPRIATLVRTDMVLALSIALCGWMILHHVARQKPWTARWQWAFCAAMTVSLLTKGPIIYAFLLPGMLAFSLLVRPRDTGRLVWSGWWTWALPVALFLIWAGAGILGRADFYQDVVINEFMSRFSSGDTETDGGQPLWFYLPHMLHKFLPWTVAIVLLPLISPTVRRSLRERPDLLWLACWTLGGLILMSLIPSKRVDRIYPALIPAALLVTGMFSVLWAQPRARLLAAVSLAVALILWPIYYGALVYEGFSRDGLILREFATEARALAAERGYPEVAVMTSNDEGMIMYFGQRRFLGTSESIDGWMNGELDALVIPDRRRPRMEEALGPLEASLSIQTDRKNEAGYFLILREPAD